jgi:diacylglycerol kinase (ATP)
MRWVRRLGGRVAFAARGFRLACRQPNLRIMLAIATAVIVVGAILDVASGAWAILLLCIGTVLGAELCNTALETLADHVEPEQDPAIRDAKDVAAAAVLVVSVVAAVTGIVVLWPYVVD